MQCVGFTIGCTATDFTALRGFKPVGEPGVMHLLHRRGYELTG